MLLFFSICLARELVEYEFKSASFIQRSCECGQNFNHFFAL